MCNFHANLYTYTLIMTMTMLSPPLLSLSDIIKNNTFLQGKLKLLN